MGQPGESHSDVLLRLVGLEASAGMKPQAFVSPEGAACSDGSAKRPRALRAMRQARSGANGRPKPMLA